MKLISLELTNFKNIKHFVLDAEGEDKNIYGKNGVGKTTLADAYYWLLTDKSSLDKKLDDDIKIADKLTGNPIKDGGVEHTVSGVLELDDGKQVTLSKIYKEKWTKQNGKADKEFSGHVTNYLIDGVNRSKKEYTQYITDNICSIDVLKMVSSTIFFNSIAWKKQREILLDVCGDISDTDVIAADERLSTLPEILNGKSVNDFIDITKSRKKKINSELDKIPVRIDETTKQLDELGQMPTREILENELKDLRQQQDRARGQITSIQNGSVLKKVANRIEQINNKIAELKSRDKLENETKLMKINREIYSKRNTLDNIASNIQNYKDVIAKNEATKQENTDKLSRLRKEYTVIFKSVFDEKQAVCPTCGQVLPQEKIDEAIKKFNTNRASSLKKINQSGKKLAIENKEIDNQNTELAKRIDVYKQEQEKSIFEIKQLEAQVEVLKNQPDTSFGYVDSEEYKNLRRELTGLNKDLNDIQTGNISKISELNSTVTQLDLDINSRMEKLALIAQAEKFKARIEELKQQHKKLGAEFETLEQQLNLAQLFITSKVHMLTDKINSKFTIARFKLFEQQINGGISECCEAITANGAPYNSAMSNGERVKISLDICATLARHYGKNLPIFVDNAESVTGMQDIEAQKILLIVSHHDELTVKEPMQKRKIA